MPEVPFAVKIQVMDEDGNIESEEIIPMKEAFDIMTEEQKEQTLNAMPEKDRKALLETMKEVKDNG